MKQNFKKASLILAAACVSLTMFSTNAMATPDINNSDNPAMAGAEMARGNGMPSELVGIDGVFTKIVNTILYAVGIISVIMLIYGGLRYVISGGNSSKVTDAKNTIMYAILGLIIALLAYAIVNFVINAVGSAGTEPPVTQGQSQQITPSPAPTPAPTPAPAPAPAH